MPCPAGISEVLPLRPHFCSDAMDIGHIKSFLGDAWTAVENNIDRALKSDIALLDSINRAVLSHPGKQIRPLLALLAAKACSGDGKVTEDSCRFAAASELLHNATLLHDDVADESDRRRGVPTLNSLMGSSASVLVGDYWLVAAMNMVLESDDSGHRVTRIFSKTLSDLAKGEMLQLQKASSGDTVEEDYYRIIYYKTASLFESAMHSAAISVSASEDIEEAVKKFASGLGSAFQIRDDIFDYSKDAMVGKPLGVDILEQKITLPLLEAMENAGERMSKDIRDMVRHIHEHPEYRDEIVSFVHDYDGMERATVKLDSFVNEAVSSLSVLPPSEAKDMLVDIAYYMAKRKN